MRLEDGEIETYRQTYLDSSSRSLAPPVNCSFLRCQFISWICFLVPPPRKEMTVKHTKNGCDNIFCKVVAHLNFWSSFWAISIMNAKLLKEKEKLRGKSDYPERVPSDGTCRHLLIVDLPRVCSELWHELQVFNANPLVFQLGHGVVHALLPRWNVILLSGGGCRQLIPPQEKK